MVKKRSIQLLILALTLFVIGTGCSSLGALVQANVEGVPVWVYEPPVGRDQISFVGKSSAIDESLSRQGAIESALEQVSAFIGEELPASVGRELIATGRSSSYPLRLTQEASTRGKGRVTSYLLIVGERSQLEEARSAATLLLQQQQQEIKELKAVATAAFRANRDLEAVVAYLKMASIASSMERSTGVALYQEGMSQVIKIISKLNINLTKSSEQLPSVNLIVRRGTGILAPRVHHATLWVSFEAFDGLGKRYVDVETFFTDNEGQINYSIDNPLIVTKGTLNIGINLASEGITKESIEAEDWEKIESILASKVISFDYEKRQVKGPHEVAALVMEYSEQGALLKSQIAHNTLFSELEKRDLFIQSALGIAQADEEELFEDLQRYFPLHRYYLIGRVGVDQINRGGSNTIVTASGELTLYDAKSLQVTFTTGRFEAVGMGEDFEKASETAFTTFGTIGASLIIRELYR